MSIIPVFLWSDILIYALMLSSAAWAYFALRREYWRIALRQVGGNRMAMLSFGVLCLYGSLGLLDTIHFKRVSAENPKGGNITSLFDLLAQPLIERTETTYSAPFATHSFSMESVQRNGQQVREFPRLAHAAINLKDPASDAAADIEKRAVTGLGLGLAIGLALFIFSWGILSLMRRSNGSNGRHGTNGTSNLYWLGGFMTVVAILVSEAVTLNMNEGYHILGTDKTGQDVFYLALKSIRTGLIVGTLTTLIVTPFAVFFGILAGYFGGWVDDLIQYVYTTLSSIPDILLIAAAMLMLQTWLAQTQVETLVSADNRLILLCVILGITSWTGLCRLIRGEVLKLREVEYIQAADAFGVGRLTIMVRHLLPNVMHIVLISVVLRFSGLVLTEAILAYIGIGVDPSTNSWGNMINQARLELARDPVVWWSILAAFTFMLGLVLPANLFGDAVRDALDPRLKTR